MPLVKCLKIGDKRLSIKHVTIKQNHQQQKTNKQQPLCLGLEFEEMIPCSLNDLTWVPRMKYSIDSH